ncbi:MAG: hypothetical protein H0U75_07145 [Legionella sp.]|nr:hypothetical protein [Legionella sp.]
MIQDHHNIEPGDQYLYQLGLGHNIKSETDKYIFFGLVELNGFYQQTNKFMGEVDPNFGGHLIYIIPSLWFSTKNLFFQSIVSLPRD